jgi:hypothetical protein
MSKKAKTKEEWIRYILDIQNNEKDCKIFRREIKLNNQYLSTGRLIYESVIGPIPKNMYVSRKCTNFRCCNPAHFYLRPSGVLSNLKSANRATPQETIDKIKGLRIQQKTIDEISSTLNISTGTVYKYVSKMPLSEETRKILRLRSGKNRSLKISATRISLWEGLNKFKDLINEKTYSKTAKGNIAESAIVYRLLIHNYSVYSSIFNGDVIDIIACNNQTTDLLKIQVKCVRRTKGSHTPMLSVKRMKGHYSFTQYENKDLDLLIGYDILNDIAYVFTWDEIKNKKSLISVTLESKENWKKLNIKEDHMH